MIPSAFFAQPRWRLGARPVATVTIVWMVLISRAALADDHIDVKSVRIEAAEAGWTVDAVFDFALPWALEEAVSKGVPLYFVTEAQLTRSRWYWFDEKATTALYSMRLSFQPLTRQYSLTTGGLQLRFSDLRDALGVIQHIRNWRVIEAADVSPGSTYLFSLRMRLDVSQLPKPFQVNAVNSSPWNLASDWYRTSFTVPTKAPVSAAPALAPVMPIASVPGAASAAAPVASAASQPTLPTVPAPMQ